MLNQNYNNNHPNTENEEKIANELLGITPEVKETESSAIRMLPISKLKYFENHPYKVIDNEEMDDLLYSIREYGVMTPITVFVNKDMQYEIVSGHRRVHVCEMLEIQEIPAIIKDYDRDQAILAMVDSNLHREKLLPSEKAFAYKMKLEALKNQNRASHFETRMRSDEILAKEMGESRATIQRLIRLTRLIMPFLDLLDYECMSFGVAYTLSGCDAVGQDLMYRFFYENDTYPSIEQAKELQKLWESDVLSYENIRTIMLPKENLGTENADIPEKLPAPKKQNIKFSFDEISDYFPGMSAKDIKSTLLSMLSEWKMKQNNRGE